VSAKIHRAGTEPRAIILAAEDDPNDVLLLKRSFAKTCLANSVVVVRDGQEVIDYIVGNPPYDDRVRYPKPALLLLDFNIPRVTGLGVLQWLQTRPPEDQVPVLLFTSAISPADTQTALSLGAKLCVTKPFDAEEWLPIVQSLEEHLKSPKIGVME
jgi:CheY-like chemotaxis protein